MTPPPRKPRIFTALHHLQLPGRGKGKQTTKKEKESVRFKDMNNQSLPLSGASIYILTNDGETSEREVMLDHTIEALGGKRTWIMSDATHTLLCSSSFFNKNTENKLALTSTVLETLETSLSIGVPVVGTSWLERISGLMPNEHWSEIAVESHKPAVVNRLESEKVATKAQNIIRRRDSEVSLGSSIRETYACLTAEAPGVVEESELRRAIELSMLDWALVFQKSGSIRKSFTKDDSSRSPHDILGVDPSATPSQIKTAYRKKARQTHPDKGGKPGEFEAVARAYRMLLHPSHETSTDQLEASSQIKTTAHWDSELKDHKNLIAELYQNSGSDLASNVVKQSAALSSLKLYSKDAGASNINEKNEQIKNSCFYLSLAASYLHGIGALSNDEDFWTMTPSDDQKLSTDEALIGGTALDLKRIIEAAVVHAHPEWAARGMVGEEVQAFSDFLVYVLDSSTILSDWSVAVFDTTSGFVDVYKGKTYPGTDEDWARSNTLTLQYAPGHYQPLLPEKGAARPTLKLLLKELETAGVLYVVTDGSD